MGGESLVGKVESLRPFVAVPDAAENGRTSAISGRHAEQMLLAEFAHELRTPLAAIVASAELLADADHRLSADRVRKTAGDIHRGSVWLQTFVENIMFANAVLGGRFRLSPEPLDLLEVLNEV